MARHRSTMPGPAGVLLVSSCQICRGSPSEQCPSKWPQRCLWRIWRPCCVPSPRWRRIDWCKTTGRDCRLRFDDGQQSAGFGRLAAGRYNVVVGGYKVYPAKLCYSRRRPSARGREVCQSAKWVVLRQDRSLGRRSARRWPTTDRTNRHCNRFRLSRNLAFSSTRSTRSVWHIVPKVYQTIPTTRHRQRSANSRKHFGASHRTSNSACDGPK